MKVEQKTFVDLPTHLQALVLRASSKLIERDRTTPRLLTFNFLVGSDLAGFLELQVLPDQRVIAR
jgi:hypothetical protein